jgi:hypothetical protein
MHNWSSGLGNGLQNRNGEILTGVRIPHCAHYLLRCEQSWLLQQPHKLSSSDIVGSNPTNATYWSTVESLYLLYT